MRAKSGVKRLPKLGIDTTCHVANRGFLVDARGWPWFTANEPPAAGAASRTACAARRIDDTDLPTSVPLRD
jgi:hypothetical protein